MKEYINNNTLVGEIVNTYPETIEVLMAKGMHCLGCPASQAESISDEVIEAVNAKINKTRAEK